MVEIRHIAIASQAADKAVEAHKTAFGFRELKKLDNERTRGCFLTDGPISIALLKFKADPCGKGMDHVGLHHFGVYT
jgi:methylmalonyl-CoA/ethylmalonyl-CoA epimerase